MEQEEQRRTSPRVMYEIEVGVRSDDNFFTGFIRNISEGGLFVATHDPLDVGSEVTIKFTVPTMEGEVTAHSIVRWVRPYDERMPDAIPGMGVQFVTLLPDTATEAINRFIQEREPEFYED
ncbi:MAG: TIGR02266 family protein [Deltaproteobacteria bacterium]|nr:TIGR02266 family protein [Deltaproteobacteria bacterium]